MSAGLGAVSDLAASAAEEGDSVSGVVERLVDARTLELRASAGELVTVMLAADAKVFRDGPAELPAFTTGERVTARGRPGAAGGWIADEVQPVYELIETQVTDRRADRIDTEAGALAVDGRTQARTYVGGFGAVAPRTIRKGDSVVALVRREPATGRSIARAIATLRQSG